MIFPYSLVWARIQISTPGSTWSTFLLSFKSYFRISSLTPVGCLLGAEGMNAIVQISGLPTTFRCISQMQSDVWDDSHSIRRLSALSQFYVDFQSTKMIELISLCLVSNIWTSLFSTSRFQVAPLVRVVPRLIAFLLFHLVQPFIVFADCERIVR